jgi:hypothetical protein
MEASEERSKKVLLFVKGMGTVHQNDDIRLAKVMQRQFGTLRLFSQLPVLRSWFKNLAIQNAQHSPTSTHRSARAE